MACTTLRRAQTSATHTYDTSSYLVSLSDTLGRTWWDQPVYDHLDRVTTVRKGASHVTTRHYRPTDGLLDQIDTPTIQAMSFRYDGLGNLVNRSDTGVAESYGYDLLNRLEKRNNTTIAAYQPNGNLTSKTDVASQAVTINAYDAAAVANPADTTAVRNLPHAVAQYTFNAQTINLKYDLNGNLLTRQNATTGETWSMKWTGFDKPRWMARTEVGTSGPLVRGSEFHYNARRSRVIQREFDSLSGTAPNQTPLHYNRKRLYALGSTLELNYTNQNTDKTSSAQNWTLDTVRIYVPGPDGIIGAREFEPARTTQQEKAIVYHYDHLGSIVATTRHTTGELATDDTGKPGKFSEDAWGQRRNPYTWSGPPQTSGPNASDDGGADSVTPRGHTGHEMLDDLGLVHMNGRIYDPLLGRFLSADIVVQNQGDLQAFNRYSYVLNRPLTMTDPTGFFYDISPLQQRMGLQAEGASQTTVDKATATWQMGDAARSQGTLTGSAMVVSTVATAGAAPLVYEAAAGGNVAAQVLIAGTAAKGLTDGTKTAAEGAGEFVAKPSVSSAVKTLAGAAEATMAVAAVASTRSALASTVPEPTVASAAPKPGLAPEVKPATPATAEASTTVPKQRNTPPAPLKEAEGRAHTIIEKKGATGQYTTHNKDGTWKQYRGSGKDHGNVPRPNVKETKLLDPRPSDGKQFPSKPEVRPAKPDEIPK